MLYYILSGCAITLPKSFDSQAENSPQIEWVKYDVTDDCTGTLDWEPPLRVPVVISMVEMIESDDGEITVWDRDYLNGYRFDVVPSNILCSPDSISTTITLGFWVE